jgi:hypothetical protein
VIPARIDGKFKAQIKIKRRITDMKKLLLMVLALMLISTMAFAQMGGSVSGTVYDSLNNPVGGAMVRLGADGHHGGGGHGGHGNNYYAQTADDGTFSIEDVGAGDYVAMASKMMVGHDSEEITVVAGQNTVVNFVLNGMGGHGGGMHGDSLEIVEVSGWAIVEVDSMRTHYFLDNNDDGEADYRLLFGPEWYDPGNGAQRPADGDSIWITGGLMGYSQPQSVVVYEINGLFWREPGQGHGGHGGDGGGHGGCNPDSLTLIETSGQAITQEMMGMTMYYLDTNFDQTSEYMLNFGAPDYDPGNGATRPEAGDTIEIVGGLMECEMMGDVIIVYEINGQFWREPGDTIMLWPAEELSADDAEENRLPVKHVIASSYPNPFNATATISFVLAQPSYVTVTVYDLLGREVAVLANGEYQVGANHVRFQADADGSAVYFYRVSAGLESTSGRMTLLK